MLSADSRDEARTGVHVSATSDANSTPSTWDASPSLDTKSRRLSKQQQRSRDVRVQSLEPLSHKANNVANAWQSEHEPLGSRRRMRNDPFEKRRQQQLQSLEDETRIYGGSGLRTTTKHKRTLRGSASPLEPLMKQIEREKRSHERQATTLARALEVHKIYLSGL